MQEALAPRQFVQLGMRHLHRAAESVMVDGPCANDFPTSVYWPVRSGSSIEGMLIRAFHLHPMLVDPVHRMELPKTTIDGHYLMQSCPDLNRCVVVSDSDELVAFELTPSRRVVGNHDRRRGVSLLRLAAVAAKCDPYQRSHWEHPIRLHGGELDERWAAAETQSAVFVLKLERYRAVGPLLARVYRLLKIWRRRGAGYARTVRKALRDETRAVSRAVRKPFRRRDAHARAFRRAVRLPLSAKRIARFAKLLYHRATKAGRLGLKRARRHARLFSTRMTAATPTTRPASSVFHVVTHVWGREYLDLFLNVCIPNQLAPGNVPALPPGSRYRILTRSNHVDELDVHPMVHALREVIPVDIVVVEALDRHGDGPYDIKLMIACHRKATADILDADAAIIMLSADFILSANVLAAVVRRHREGYRAVVNTGLRLNKESFLQRLDESDTAPAALSSRELVRMALPYLHSHERSMFADASRFSKAPVAVYWRIGDEELLARCLHLHPLMVDPMRPLPLLVGTNDGPYLAQACPDLSRVHVVTDSDELQMFELTAAQRQVVGTTKAGASAWRAAIMAARCDGLQRYYWQHHPVRLHTADLDARWIAATVASEKFARQVMRRRRYSRLARRYFQWAGRIDKRRARYLKTWHRQRRRVRFERLQAWSDRQMRVWEHRRPRLRPRRIPRSLKLFLHRTAKASRLRVKRIHRRVRLFLPT